MCITEEGVKRLIEALRKSAGPIVGPHLTVLEVCDYASGQLDEVDMDRLDLHLATCEECLEDIEMLMSDEDDTTL